MLDKIEKIARIKVVENDVGRRFDSGRQRDGDSGFAATLRRAINKKDKPSEISEAYSLELNSLGGEGLFYFGATDLRALLS